MKSLTRKVLDPIVCRITKQHKMTTIKKNCTKHEKNLIVNYEEIAKRIQNQTL